MGGNVVEAQPQGQRRRGGGVFGLINRYLENASWKAREDYRTAQARERVADRFSAETAAHIIKGRANVLNYQEMADYHRRNFGEVPGRLVVGDVSHDYSSNRKIQDNPKKPKNGNKPDDNGPDGGGPKPPKGGKDATLKDVKAALKAKKIDKEQAADLSPTYAKNLGKKAAADSVKTKPVKPTKNKVAKPTPVNTVAPVNTAAQPKPAGTPSTPKAPAVAKQPKAKTPKAGK